ncbi:endospore germination permease [Paenibacillus elgii]|uniref:GerAB/ArcD/ProY family transporter n=1 Tax=Paenibacillus elgii TaxID=189691 RepID=UPI002D7C1447|nr:endospore germination permease [Paenibacillus elgii]
MKMMVSGTQIFWILVSMEIGAGLLIIISPTISLSKQDAWISMIISGGFSVFLTFLGTKLSLNYPNQTLFEYSQTILGKWFGKFILVPYLIFWYAVVGIVLRQFAEVVLLVLLPHTPMSLVILLMLLVVIFVTYQGIEGIGRCCEVIGPISMLMIILLFILMIPDINLKYILPIYTKSGWITIGKGALPSYHFFSNEGCWAMLMLMKFMTNPKEGSSKALWAVAISTFLISIGTFLVLTVFGPNLGARMWYPFFTLTGYIQAFGFVQGLIQIFTGVWLLSIFIELAFVFFITCYGTAQFLQFKNWKKGIGFVAAIGFSLSLLPQNIIESSVIFPKISFTYFTPICTLFIPILLLFIGMIRKKRVQ